MKPLLTPAEARQAHTEQISPQVEQVLARLNELLVNAGGNRVSVAAELLGDDAQVRGLVEARLREAGWHVKCVSDQRDGDFYWISG